MAFLTTNPSPFIINVPEFQNVITSATGNSGFSGLSNSVNDLLTYINTANSQLNINTIGSSTTGNITFTSNINLSNSVITFSGSNLLGSNTLNGPAGFLAFQVNGVERARLTATGLGIGTTVPQLPLEVQGGAIIRGPLYVSSFGAVSSATGNIIASGDIFANGFFYPSDSRLKKDISVYESPGLPTPVEFTWRGSGEHDIGVLADDLLEIEPLCVTRAPSGFLTVDYAKLSVLLLAEVRTLKTQMSTVMARLP
jgi:hypothetical protein